MEEDDGTLTTQMCPGNGFHIGLSQKKKKKKIKKKLTFDFFPIQHKSNSAVLPTSLPPHNNLGEDKQELEGADAGEKITKKKNKS